MSDNRTIDEKPTLENQPTIIEDSELAECLNSNTENFNDVRDLTAQQFNKEFGLDFEIDDVEIHSILSNKDRNFYSLTTVLNYINKTLLHIAGIRKQFGILSETVEKLSKISVPSWVQNTRKRNITKAIKVKGRKTFMDSFNLYIMKAYENDNTIDFNEELKLLMKNREKSRLFSKKNKFVTRDRLNEIQDSNIKLLSNIIDILTTQLSDQNLDNEIRNEILRIQNIVNNYQTIGNYVLDNVQLVNLYEIVNKNGIIKRIFGDEADFMIKQNLYITILLISLFNNSIDSLELDEDFKKQPEDYINSNADERKKEEIIELVSGQEGSKDIPLSIMIPDSISIEKLQILGRSHIHIDTQKGVTSLQIVIQEEDQETLTGYSNVILFFAFCLNKIRSNQKATNELLINKIMEFQYGFNFDMYSKKVFEDFKTKEIYQQAMGIEKPYRYIFFNMIFTNYTYLMYNNDELLNCLLKLFLETKDIDKLSNISNYVKQIKSEKIDSNNIIYVLDNELYNSNLTQNNEYINIIKRFKTIGIQNNILNQISIIDFQFLKSIFGYLSNNPNEVLRLNGNYGYINDLKTKFKIIDEINSLLEIIPKSNEYYNKLSDLILEYNENKISNDEIQSKYATLKLQGLDVLIDNIKSLISNKEKEIFLPIFFELYDKLSFIRPIKNCFKVLKYLFSKTGTQILLGYQVLVKYKLNQTWDAEKYIKFFDKILAKPTFVKDYLSENNYEKEVDELDTLCTGDNLILEKNKETLEKYYDEFIVEMITKKFVLNNRVINTFISIGRYSKLSFDENTDLAMNLLADIESRKISGNELDLIDLVISVFKDIDIDYNIEQIVGNIKKIYKEKVNLINDTYENFDPEKIRANKDQFVHDIFSYITGNNIDLDQYKYELNIKQESNPDFNFSGYIYLIGFGNESLKQIESELGENIDLNKITILPCYKEDITGLTPIYTKMIEQIKPGSIVIKNTGQMGKMVRDYLRQCEISKTSLIHSNNGISGAIRQIKESLKIQ